jgi:DNA phosphorothioation-associated putative methyltransferase
VIGKKVIDELYIHLEWADHLEVPGLVSAIREAVVRLNAGKPNVAKVNLNRERVSLLRYADFDIAPFPELCESWTFANGLDRPPNYRRYDNSLNPPILHRKELLVGRAHPSYDSWAAITQTAEELGLFDVTRVIGFRLNWERAIAEKGYCLEGSVFVPIGNAEAIEEGLDAPPKYGIGIQRHLTALTRRGLSAPVQLLIRHTLLSESDTFFDYGCGRGDDISALRSTGINSKGWDPHFAPDTELHESDVVNIGFVINVIEDAAERADALRRAFSLSRRVLSIAVMLDSGNRTGLPFSDGLLTTRNTFQKYFTQSEFKEYIEHALEREAHMVAPGVAFVFADFDAEQRFTANRYRRRGLADRVNRLTARGKNKRTQLDHKGPQRALKRVKLSQVEKFRPWLDAYWSAAIELGRWPEDEEFVTGPDWPTELRSLSQARRLVDANYEVELLNEAALARSDDLLVYFAARQFEKREPYKRLEPRLKRDVKTFFGDYRSAQSASLLMLVNTGQPEHVLAACKKAAEAGLGALTEEHSLELHFDLVEQLPALLRTYVHCGLRLWDANSEIHAVKIHIHSGKLTLLEYDNFETSPIPELRRRIKINLRRLQLDVFEYGSLRYPKPALVGKSRLMHEDQEGYGEQLAFDEAIWSQGLLPSDDTGSGSLSLEQINHQLSAKRMQIVGDRLVPSKTIPNINERCGKNFCYRDLIECGETQLRLRLDNTPRSPDTYNALYALATQVLDPVVDYFGAIKLTYGFSSSKLASAIKSKIAPSLDQHASCEVVARSGKMVCSRGGAACDFIVEDEDMREVAEWIITNIEFDRLYFYGADRPIHISYGPENTRYAAEMHRSPSGRLQPRPLRLMKRMHSRTSGGS